jgi:hypothetical protein
VEFWAVASTRRLCENARQSQAASWRAASSFPLVNYLPVTPMHEPECQLVNHVALIQLDCGRRRYRIIGEEIEPAEAEAIKEAASRVLRGESICSIAFDFNDRGVKPVGV